MGGYIAGDREIEGCGHGQGAPKSWRFFLAVLRGVCCEMISGQYWQYEIPSLF